MHLSVRLARKGLSVLVALAFGAAGTGAHAGLISTEATLEAQAGAGARAQLVAWVQRDEVTTALAAAGQDPALVAAQVATLSDLEIAELSGRIDSLPAGGSTLGVVAVVLVVLVALDYLGVTDIFPWIEEREGVSSH